MVSTRGRQSLVAAEGIPNKITASSNAETSNKLTEDAHADTIGSRLRKRRRTGSVPTNEPPRRGKRPSARKAKSPQRKRKSVESKQDGTNEESAELRSERSLGKRRLIEEWRNGNAESEQQASDNGSISDGDPWDKPPHLSDFRPPQYFNPHAQSGSDAPTAIDQDTKRLIEEIVSYSEGVQGNEDAVWGASWELKMRSLPVLDNLATQILYKLATSSYETIIDMVANPDVEPGASYATLQKLFVQTKDVYQRRSSFLSIAELRLPDVEATDTVRVANLATFVSSLFGSQEVGFYELNEYFLDIFVEDGSRVLKSHAALFLDLKTQSYISAISKGVRSKEDILDEIFPVDLEARVLARRAAKQLAPSEAEFLQRVQNRRQALVDEPDTPEAISALPDKYHWERFLKDVSSYVDKNFQALVGESAAQKAARGRPPTVEETEQYRIKQEEDFEKHRQLRYLRQQQAHHQQQIHQPQLEQMLIQPTIEHGSAGPSPVDGDDIIEKAARAARFAMQGILPTNGPPMPPPHTFHPYQPHPPPFQQFHWQHHPPPPPPVPVSAPPPYYHGPPHPPMNGHVMPPGMLPVPHIFTDPNGVPYPAQTAPTQVLYERARQAATTKSSPTSRRAGTPSQRRPWSTEEENALMAGLDRVKGPHWSQILAMFGAGGTVSEVLKDRNQVQLKDKARNLKLFFLKSNTEVPYYLQFVTGELKTRAPAQAARNDPRRHGSQDDGLVAEDRGHVEAVMTLAGGVLPALEGDERTVVRDEGEDGLAAVVPVNGIGIPQLDGACDGLAATAAASSLPLIVRSIEDSGLGVVGALGGAPSVVDTLAEDAAKEAARAIAMMQSGVGAVA